MEHNNRVGKVIHLELWKKLKLKFHYSGKWYKQKQESIPKKMRPMKFWVTQWIYFI